MYTVHILTDTNSKVVLIEKILGGPLGMQPCRLATGAQKSSLVA